MLVNDLNNVRRFYELMLLHDRQNLFFSFGKNTDLREKKKNCNYFFSNFIHEDDISVLERGRDRIFRQFHVVYRYENTDWPSQNYVLLV